MSTTIAPAEIESARKKVAHIDNIDIARAVLSPSYDPPVVDEILGGLFSEEALLEAERPALPLLPHVAIEVWLDAEPPEPDQIIEGICDAGDKVASIGGSKERKSFEVLQRSMCVAAGIPWMGCRVPKPRRVLLIQLEVRDVHYHRRVRRMREALGLSREDVAGRMFIVNGRGLPLSVPSIERLALHLGAEVVVIDPLYKLTEGDENAAHDMKPILADFDRMAEATGASVWYVHHDPKGDPTQRRTSDRGAGSNVIGRDYDACITLTEHRDEPDAVVVHTLLRNYPPREPFTMQWDMGKFIESDLPPVAGYNTAAKGPDVDSLVNMAVAMADRGATHCTTFKDQLRKEFGLTDAKTRDLYNLLLEEGHLAKSVREPVSGGGQYVGTPEDIEVLNAEFASKRSAGSTCTHC